MIKKAMVIGLVLLIISLMGCKKSETPPAEQPSAEAAVTDVDADISDVDALDEDLNTAELDDFEGDLDNIDW